ncbi:MAG: hypothetical protein WBD56_01505 [Anaerolineales bacterium]
MPNPVAVRRQASTLGCTACDSSLRSPLPSTSSEHAGQVKQSVLLLREMKKAAR